MRIQFEHSFEEIIAINNLLSAWREFSRGKRNKPDVAEFSLLLMDNLWSLRDDCLHHTYRHGSYQAFRIADPKPRDIHKASVRDRVLHHAIYSILYPFFDKTFIADSFSCRINKGTHRALDRFAAFESKASKNNMKTCWVLKGDIKKFFASIDHATLIELLDSYICDPGLRWMLREVIGSFMSIEPGVGLPLGNLISQLFVNIYMNSFDQFVKHQLNAEYYIRYADDFVIASSNREWLERILFAIEIFLRDRLKLRLHPDKVFITTFASGVDFLGWIHFPHHRVLRTSTKRRMMRRIVECPVPAVFASYLGLLSHGDAFEVGAELRNQYSFNTFL